jgi:hypothetical protein
LRWLATQFQTIRDRLRDEIVELRGLVNAKGLHGRTPGIVADLAIGWHYWLDYAFAVGAIARDARDALADRTWRALTEAAAAQAEHVAAADPVDQFWRLLLAVLASGRAHCTTSTGDAPDQAVAWGWRGIGEPRRTEWLP